MACINSVRQALVSSDVCPLVIAVCWSFPGLESDSLPGVNVPTCLATWRWRNRATLLGYKRVCKSNVCRSCLSQLYAACNLHSQNIWVWELTVKTSVYLYESPSKRRQKENVCVCVLPAIKHRVTMLLFPPELGLSAGALCMYPEKAGVCWSISEAQPGAAQPPAPHSAQGYVHKTTH